MTTMCGRFTQAYSWEEVHAFLSILGPAQNLRPRYNLAPTQSAAVVRADGSGTRHLSMLRWGLIPAWAKDVSIGSKLINARGETVAKKPSFRSAFESRRCLVPADGFYEWTGEKGAKQPYRIVPTRDLFAFAGLWESWKKDGDEQLESFTIITTEANRKLAPLHARMPVILDPADFEHWLSPQLAANDALDLLRPAPDGAVDFHAISKHVNNARNDDAGCIAPLSPFELAKG